MCFAVPENNLFGPNKLLIILPFVGLMLVQSMIFDPGANKNNLFAPNQSLLVFATSQRGMGNVKRALQLARGPELVR